MKNIFTVFACFIMMLFLSCDQVENPFPENLGTSFFINDKEIIVEPSLEIKSEFALNDFINNNAWKTQIGADNTNRRFVVLEEFTGHTCSNCPRGTREISRLEGKYQEQFIPVGIHAGGFAEPFPPNPSNKYVTDFRVEGGHGEVYDATFSNGSYPSGIISRIGATSTLETKWEAAIENIKNLSPKASLSLTNYYDSTIHVVRSEITIEWKETLAEDYNLQLYVLENNIEDWQLDGTNEIPNYKHKHVLRKVVNDTFGKQLEASVSGNQETIQYIYTIKPEWVAEEVEVVAFIFNNNSNSYEIIQANSAVIK